AFLVFAENEENTFTHQEISGSRVETRTCKVMDDLTHLSAASNWAGLRKFLKVETETYLKSENRTLKDQRYYIVSYQATAEKYLKATRNHWAIENKLHWGLDVIFNEDSSRKRNNNVAENFSIIFKVALKLLKDKQKEMIANGQKSVSI